MTGKCSKFGGAEDKGMSKDSGLALYEPWEADLRPDIFFPEDSKWLDTHPVWVDKYPHQRQPTWARLRTSFYFLALRYDRKTPREILQNTPIRVMNPKTGEWAISFLVDWGPHEDTGRLVDCSDGLMKRLAAQTDDMLDVKTLSV